MTHCTEIYIPKRINCTTFGENFPSSFSSTYPDLHVQSKCQHASSLLALPYHRTWLYTLNFRIFLWLLLPQNNTISCSQMEIDQLYLCHVCAFGFMVHSYPCRALSMLWFMGSFSFLSAVVTVFAMFSVQQKTSSCQSFINIG